MAFFSLLSLKYYILFFLFSPCSRPSCRVPLRASPLVSSTLQTRGHPCPSLLPPFLACPPLLLPAVCSVAAVPFALSPSPPLYLSGAPLKLPGGLLCVVPCVLWWLPSLVRHQAQNAMTVGADAPRICPRPCLLLPMCCRVFRWLFRVLSRGFRPSVRVCVLLPCVVWW